MMNRIRAFFALPLVLIAFSQQTLAGNGIDRGGGSSIQTVQHVIWGLIPLKRLTLLDLAESKNTANLPINELEPSPFSDPELEAFAAQECRKILGPTQDARFCTALRNQWADIASSHVAVFATLKARAEKLSWSFVPELRSHDDRGTVTLAVSDSEAKPVFFQSALREGSEIKLSVLGWAKPVQKFRPLSLGHKVALVFHEILYAELQSKLGHTTSEPTRKWIGKLFSWSPACEVLQGLAETLGIERKCTRPSVSAALEWSISQALLENFGFMDPSKTIPIGGKVSINDQLYIEGIMGSVFYERLQVHLGRYGLLTQVERNTLLRIPYRRTSIRKLSEILLPTVREKAL